MTKIHKFIIGISVLTINSIWDELVRFLFKLLLNFLVQ